MNAKKNIAKSSQTTANSVSSRLYVCTTAAFIPSNWNTNSHMLTSMWPDASSCRIWYKTFRTSMNWHLNSLSRQCQLLNRSTLCLSHWPTSHFPLFFGYCWSRIFYRPAALPVIQTTVSNSFTRFHCLYPSPLPFAHTHHLHYPTLFCEMQFHPHPIPAKVNWCCIIFNNQHLWLHNTTLSKTIMFSLQCTFTGKSH